MEEQNRSIKFVCRMEQGQFAEHLYIDGDEQPQSDSKAVTYARQFFGSFSPQDITQQMAADCPEGFVLVFRTTEKQIAPFGNAVEEHQTTPEVQAS